jgi:hypothetical protein
LVTKIWNIGQARFWLCFGAFFILRLYFDVQSDSDVKKKKAWNESFDDANCNDPNDSCNKASEASALAPMPRCLP